MKVLVIGGSGFIGSHVVDRLLTHGHSVRVFDRQPERFRAPLPDVDYCFGDFADRMALVEALSGVDAVYHLLSTTVPGTADLDPKTDVQDNLIGAINLLEFDAAAWALQNSVPVFGRDRLWNSGHDSHSRDARASSHQFLRDRQSDDRTLSGNVPKDTRPFTRHHPCVQSVWPAAGAFRRPRCDLDIPPPDIGRGNPSKSGATGRVVRDYLEVGDLAELCVRAGTSDREGAYNAGSGHGLSINEIVRSHSHGDRIGFRNGLQAGPPHRRAALGAGLFPRQERLRLGMQDGI